MPTEDTLQKLEDLSAEMLIARDERVERSGKMSGAEKVFVSLEVTALSLP